MIGRLLAAAAVTAVLTGTAMAQMAAPPPANPGPNNNTNSGGQMSPGDRMGSGGATGSQMGGSHMSKSPSSPSGTSSMGQANRKPTSMSGNRQTAQTPGHQQDNIADKLNACESKPMSERQSCINDATRM